jgi:hypothetical protein
VGTAVVAGTAGAVHHQQQKRWEKQAYEDYAVQQLEQGQTAPQPQYAPPPQPVYAAPPVQYAAPEAPAAGDDMMEKLNQLASMHSAGVLTDEEFAAAKQKILAS